MVQLNNLKSSLDRFIVLRVVNNHLQSINLKSSLDRFIATGQGELEDNIKI